MTASADGAALRLELRIDTHALVDLMAQLEAYAARHEWSAALAHDVRLVVEELTLNAMAHGQQPAESGWIRWTISATPDGVALQLEDGGVAFNPFTGPPPDLESPLEDRHPGGLGLHLVQALTTQRHCERRDGQNRLTMTVPSRLSGHV